MLENEREKALEEARRQAQKILADAKSASDAAFDELAELKRQAAAEQFAIDVVGARAKHARKLNEAAARANPSLPRRTEGPKRAVRPGDIVAFGGAGTHAEVLTEPDKTAMCSSRRALWS